MKTCLCNFDPLKPHFYIVKLGFTGVYIIFLISAQKHRLWVLVRTASPRRFQRVPTIYVLSSNMKNIQNFLSENFPFLVVKFSIYLNRRVFVMTDEPNSLIMLMTALQMSKLQTNVQILYLFVFFIAHDTSRKHTYIIMTPLNPTFI